MVIGGVGGYVRPVVVGCVVVNWRAVDDVHTINNAVVVVVVLGKVKSARIKFVQCLLKDALTVVLFAIGVRLVETLVGCTQGNFVGNIKGQVQLSVGGGFVVTCNTLPTGCRLVVEHFCNVF